MLPFRDKTPKHSLNVKKYKHYSSYKDFLKKDFNSRCGYCDDKLNGFRNFVIDHFVPQNPDNFKHDIKPNFYLNLIYSCPFCNSFKSNKWPTNNAKVTHNNKVGFIKPTKEKYGKLFYRDRAGKIHPNSNELARYIYRELKLDFPIHELNWKFEKLLNQELILKEIVDKVDNEPLKKEIIEIRNSRLEIMDEILAFYNE